MKHIDFKPERSLVPMASDPLYEPDLSTLVRGRAVGGPLNGSKIEAQPNWNGAVGKGSLDKPYPGRYVYSTDRTWVWEENNPIKPRS